MLVVEIDVVAVVELVVVDDEAPSDKTETVLSTEFATKTSLLPESYKTPMG